ncbi:hypothetical protein KAR91_37515 [Candidatus Pacearchaeota archaeon]|nr:hypothetical protein [Candidatus Pacearchaeota archaeon]
MKRDKFQDIVARSYEGGEFAHIGEKGTEFSIEGLSTVGDGFFAYLMVGLSEAEDCDSHETAIKRLDTYIRQLEEVQIAFEKARDRDKKYHHAFSVNFAIYSDNEVDSVSDKELRNAMGELFIRLSKLPEGGVLEECENLFDTYEQKEGL